MQTRPLQLLLLSAKTGSALDTATANLTEYLKQNSNANLADVAYTLQLGRGGYSHRRFLVCKDRNDALSALETRDASRLFTLFQEPRHRPVVFMFPGQGTQYVGMGRGLYRSERVFREYIDLCAEQLSAHLNLDLREVLYPTEEGEAEANRLLGQTFVTQPALFCIEYALAQLWMSWGVVPSAMIGHSIGEYAAACLANVFSLEDALALVAARGQLMQQLPSGAMLAVMLSETETRSLLHNGLALAAVNGAKNCVVSGTSTAIQALHDQLKQQDVHSQVLHTSHAFHSEMMESILEAFTDRVRQVKLNAPAIPFLSNVTGAWQNAQAIDPTYWSRHLRETVRFADGLSNLLQDAERILLEVGPGQTLNALVRQHTSQVGNPVVVSSLPRPHDGYTDIEFLLNSVGKFWLGGGQIDWARFYPGEQRRRIPLPTYPFERQRYYLEPDHQSNGHSRPSSGKKADVADWFYIPSWRQFDLPRLTKPAKEFAEDYSWLIFCDDSGVGEALAQRLAQRGEEIVVVHAGEQLRRTADRTYTLNPAQKSNYDALLKELVSRGIKFTKVIHLWSLDQSAVDSFERAQQSGLYSLFFLTQALAEQSLTNSLEFVVVTDSVQEVNGEESLRPDRATVLGACKVIPQEYPEITCRTIDVVSHARNGVPTRLIDQLLAELTEKVSERVVAYRGRHRWIQSFEPVRLEKELGAQSRLSDGGVYLITGGLGGVGLALAQHLARTHKAKLALLGRSGLPSSDAWEQWLEEHDDDDDVSRKIRKVRELEAAGAEVLLLRADVSNEEQMFAAVARTVEHFGRIDGVIYGAAAGASADKEIRDTTPADCMVQFQAKAQGLMVLEKVLQSRDYKFCLMLSSLSSILGGMTFAAYAAANVFMDTFVRKHNQSHPETWLAVNWDAWNLEEAQPGAKLRAVTNDAAINAEDGGEALERILSIGPLSQILVSTTDLYPRLERWLSFEDSHVAVTVEKSEIAVLHPRPNLLNAYVAPSNELEQDLAETWQELLGIEQVGINDNFFELGGHSLLATMVMSRLRKEFGVELPLRSFFESPTVSGLALIIAQRVIDNQDEQSIAQLLESAAK